MPEYYPLMNPASTQVKDQAPKKAVYPPTSILEAIELLEDDGTL